MGNYVKLIYGTAADVRNLHIHLAKAKYERYNTSIATAAYEPLPLPRWPVSGLPPFPTTWNPSSDDGDWGSSAPSLGISTSGEVYGVVRSSSARPAGRDRNCGAEQPKRRHAKSKLDTPCVRLCTRVLVLGVQATTVSTESWCLLGPIDTIKSDFCRRRRRLTTILSSEKYKEGRQGPSCQGCVEYWLDCDRGRSVGDHSKRLEDLMG